MINPNEVVAGMAIGVMAVWSILLVLQVLPALKRNLDKN